jgi:hypothetical protein
MCAEDACPVRQVAELADVVEVAGVPEGSLEACEIVFRPGGGAGQSKPVGAGGLQSDDAVVVEDDGVGAGGVGKEALFSRARGARAARAAARRAGSSRAVGRVVMLARAPMRPGPASRPR